MRTFNLNPLYRSTVGFDRMFNVLDGLSGGEVPSQTYPPYNIERTVENEYRISMAVAGFAEAELNVEAKANTEEIESSSKSKKDGRAQIEAALAQTKEALGVEPKHDWINRYYQFCNRVATLHFLNTQDIPAHLLFVYFVGDHVPNRTCPQDAEAWKPALLAQQQHVGLPADHPLAHRIHKLFLPVCP